MKMRINEEKVFTTSDLPLATTLSLYFPIETINKDNPHRVEFYFEKSDELEEIVSKYWRKELEVEPQAFSNQMKVIKTRIYSGI